MRLRRERIRHVDEECQCRWCGWPAYVGDLMFF